MKLIISSLLLSVIGIFVSCSGNEKQYTQIHGYAQGTTYNITYSSAEDLKEEIDSLLNLFNESLSNYSEESVISKVNKAKDSITVTDSLFLAFFALSNTIYTQSDSLFDISVAHLANAWKFGFKQTESMPDSAKIDSILTFTGLNKISLQGTLLVKQDSSIAIISNAIAQGMAVDYISMFLDSKQIENYLVEIGGEVRTKGKNAQDAIWRVGIDLPIEDSTKREIKAVVSLTNSSLATSGNYRKFYISGCKKYSHTINPKTGFPVRHNLLSATIVTNNCGKADAYATTCMVKGLEAAKLFIQEMNINGYLIYEEDGIMKTWMSKETEKLVTQEF
ncbi:MAG: FAD:protein FMN transferase [Bacteroidales bacterium]|nr:FAD:protein FMN transferase [Bacteroidales bacterium]